MRAMKALIGVVHFTCQMYVPLLLVGTDVGTKVLVAITLIRG